MALQCEHCQEIFPNNTSLYKHKHKVHNKPTIVLVNHSHKKMNDKNAPKRTRPSDNNGQISTYIPKRPRVTKKDPQNDEDLTVVDKYIDPGEKPTDSEPRKIPSNYDSQNDEGLKVVDEYNADPESDDQLTIIDSYDDDGQSDENLSIVDQYDNQDKDQPIVNYKTKYFECLKAHKKLRMKFIKKIAKNENQHKINLTRVKRELQNECQEEINKIKKFHERQKSDLEDLKDSLNKEKLQNLKTMHQTSINELRETHKREMSGIEEQCQKKLKLLNDQIKTMQEDDEDLSSLSKAIFNCTTMEEIFEIQKLIKNHQLDDVIQNHLPTLQNLFLSLSYGIIPICQPQRQKITDDQRSVVEKVQAASSQSAKKILHDKRLEIINLFTIIKDSIKLARDTYNKYSLNV